MSMNSPFGGKRPRGGPAPSWTPPAGSPPSIATPSTYPPPMPGPVAAPSGGPMPGQARGRGSSVVLIAEVVVIVLLLGGAVAMGVAYAGARHDQASAKRSADAAAAALTARQAAVQKATAAVAGDKQISALIAVADGITTSYRQGPATLFTTVSPADGDAVLQKEIGDYKADQQTLASMSVPAAQQQQLSAIKAALAPLISATQAVLVALDSNASSVPNAPVNQAFQAVQTVESSALALERSLGTT
jgi:hypothetical protein